MKKLHTEQQQISPEYNMLVNIILTRHCRSQIL